MTQLQANIISLFHSLPPGDQVDLAERLYAEVVSSRMYDVLSREQCADLEVSIQEANQNKGDTSATVFARLARVVDIAKA